MPSRLWEMVDSDYSALSSWLAEGRQVVYNIEFPHGQCVLYQDHLFCFAVYRVSDLDYSVSFCAHPDLPIDLIIAGYPALFMSLELDGRKITGASFPHCYTSNLVKYPVGTRGNLPLICGTV